MGDITGAGEADPERDPLDGLELNDDFVRGAAHKEASARARMLGARWRSTPPVDPGGRRWTAPEAGREATRRRRSRRVPKLVAVVLAAALTVGGLAFSGLLGRHPGPVPGPATPGGPTAALKDPFAGTPAASWADNADGIALPPARAVGALSAGAVGQDLAQARFYLVVAFLNPQILGGGSPQPLLDMLATVPRGLLTQALAHPTFSDDPLMWLSRFNPRTTLQVGSVVKVHGTVTDAPDGDGGLVVNADFVFVYAARQAPHGTVVERVVARRVLHFRFYDPARYQVEADRLYVAGASGYTADDRCDLIDGYLNPYFPGTPRGTGSGPAVDPYATQPLPSPGGTTQTCMNMRPA
ncbi:hypothetical protein ABH931_003582 [Streptacidiphilus sp. MAP12-33]|uniref:SCO2583/SCO2584 N-terminal domain-containing protein n=1 Tax=Streptacidiphilus sp. MAP12-33 TaxID=3156266 RepID=UPI003519A3FD